MKRLQVGGATGSVGDPSGRSTERTALSQDTLDHNVASISSQVRHLFQQGVPFAAKRGGSDPDQAKSNVAFVNNRDWTGNLSLLDFLSGPGKRARVSTMLSRERCGHSVRQYWLGRKADFPLLQREESATLLFRDLFYRVRVSAASSIRLSSPTSA